MTVYCGKQLSPQFLPVDCWRLLLVWWLSLSYQTALQNTKYQDSKKIDCGSGIFTGLVKNHRSGKVRKKIWVGGFFTCLSILEIVKTYIIIVIYAFIHSFLIVFDQFQSLQKPSKWFHSHSWGVRPIRKLFWYFENTSWYGLLRPPGFCTNGMRGLVMMIQCQCQSKKLESWRTFDSAFKQWSGSRVKGQSNRERWYKSELSLKINKIFVFLGIKLCCM